MNNKIIAHYNEDKKLDAVTYNGKYIELKSSDLKQEFQELEKQYPGIYDAYHKPMRTLQKSLKLYNQSKELRNAGNEEEANRLLQEAIELKKQASETFSMSKDVSKKDQMPEEISNLKVYDKAKEKKKFSLKKKIMATVLSIAVMAGAFVACSQANMKAPDTQVTTEDQLDQDLSKLSLEELMELLHAGDQREAFEEMSEAQNYFNNTAAPTIKTEADKGGQLYLTGEEMITIYKYANSFTKSPKEFYEIFGGSSFEDKITTASEVLVAYYLRATQKSGIATMFGEEAENIESLYLNWNANKTKENRAALRSALFKDFDRATIDNLKDKDPESASYILTFMLPTLLQNGIVSNSEYKDLLQQNRTVTCNEIINTKLKAVAEYAEERSIDNELDNIDVVLEMPRAMDEANVLVKNRVVVGAGLPYETQEQIKAMTSGSKAFNKTYSAPKKSTRKASEKEVQQKFSKKEIQAAEDEADKKFHDKYDEINAKEEAYKKDGYSIGYNAVYQPLFELFVRYYSAPDVYSLPSYDYAQQLIDIELSKVPSSKKYVSQYKAGIQDGGYQGYLAAKKEAKEQVAAYDKNHPQDNTNSNQSSNQGSTNNNNNNTSSNQNNTSNNNNTTTTTPDPTPSTPEPDYSDDFVPTPSDTTTVETYDENGNLIDYQESVAKTR